MMRPLNHTSKSLLTFFKRNFAAGLERKQGSIKYIADGALPLDVEGTIALPQMPKRRVVSEYLRRKNVTEPVLIEHFEGMADKFFTDLATLNYKNLESIVEPRFLSKLKEHSVELFGDQNKFQRTPDKQKPTYIVDSTFFNGISYNRDLNGDNLDYTLKYDFEEDGVLMYIHKYFTGLNFYYLYRENQENLKILEGNDFDKKSKHEQMELNAMARDIHFKFRKQMIENSLSFVLRVTLQLRNFGRFEIGSQNDLYSSKYTGNHILLFENQLRKPSSLLNIDRDMDDFIYYHKLNFSNWRLVDVDNYMKGNPFFNKFQSIGEWKSQVEDLVSPRNVRPFPRIRGAEEGSLPEQNIYVKEALKFYEEFEPNSNIGIFKSQKEGRRKKRVEGEEGEQEEEEKQEQVAKPEQKEEQEQSQAVEEEEPEEKFGVRKPR